MELYKDNTAAAASATAAQNKLAEAKWESEWFKI
jgi:hypothetical protein